METLFDLSADFLHPFFVVVVVAGIDIVFLDDVEVFAWEVNNMTLDHDIIASHNHTVWLRSLHHLRWCLWAIFST